MKNKKLTLLCSIGLVLILVLTTIFAACAQETAPASPAAPAKPTPTTPATPAKPATPSTPAKPAPAPAAEVLQFRVPTQTAPGNTVWTLGLSAKLPEIFAEKTNGRVEITTYPGGAIVEPADSLDALSSGMFEMHVSTPSYWRGTIPVLDILSGLPMTWRVARDVSIVMKDLGMIDVIRQGYTDAGYNVRFMSDLPSGQVVLVTTKPVRTVEDLQGLKLRTYGGWLDLFTELGAAPVYLPHSEVYSALALGAIEGVCTSPESHLANKVYEICKYSIRPSLLGHGVDEIVMNQSTWDSLDGDLQQMVTSAVEEYRRWYAEYYRVYYAEVASSQLVEEGMEEVQILPEEFDKITVVAMAQWETAGAQDALSAKALEIMLGYFKVAGYIK